MPTMKELLQWQSDHIDSVLSEFTIKLDKVFQAASRDLFKELRDKLRVNAGGKIAATASNQRTIARLDTRFNELIEEHGYSATLDRFTATFNGQFQWFTKVIEHINNELVWPIQEPNFTKADFAEFEVMKLNTQELLRSVVERVSARARTKVMLSTGGMTPTQLTDHLSRTLGTSIAESQNLAETSISSFYRAITDRGYQLIEQDLPGFEIRYNYEGPLDKLTRPFCTKVEKLSRRGQTWTRAEIDKMNNGQIPNVFVSGGGYRCRHQWVISTKVLKEQQQKKLRPKGVTPPVAPEKGDVVREIAATRKVNNARLKRNTGADLPTKQIQDLRKETITKIKAERSKRRV